MDKDVIISIKGRQMFENMDDEMVELVTSGRFCRAEDVYTITYNESELTGMDGTTTMFRVEKDKVTLTRSGQNISQLIFQAGRKHFSMYNTLYGGVTVGVTARTVTTSLTDSGGDVEIDYAIEIDHAVAGENMFRLNVREVNKPGSFGGISS